eukprot:212488-Prymnesium_polylepis.1
MVLQTPTCPRPRWTVLAAGRTITACRSSRRRRALRSDPLRGRRLRRSARRDGCELAPACPAACMLTRQCISTAALREHTGRVEWPE